MSTEDLYKKALDYVKDSNNAGGTPSTGQKLVLYALFKQITEGPNKTPKPKAFDMVNKAKWDAWTKLGNISKEEAMKQYIAMIDKISPGWRQNTSSSTTASATPSTSTAATSAPATKALAAPAAVEAPVRPSVFNPNLLKGRVALITGGGSGICKGITEVLMAHGCDTAIMSRTLAKLEEAAAELQGKYPSVRCFAVQGDVRDYAQVETAIDKILEKFGKIDILVNGAAGNFLAPAVNLSSNAFKTVLEIDTVGTFNVSRAVFIKTMRPRKEGSIINLSMTLHTQGASLQVHAGAAKAAIDAMTKQMAVEWGLDGVRLNAIAIGPIDATEGLKRLMPAAVRASLLAKIPLKRFGTVYDIGNACLFLASEASSYMTGSIVTVDGASMYTTSGLMYPESMAFFENMKKAPKKAAAAAKSKM